MIWDDLLLRRPEELWKEHRIFKEIEIHKMDQLYKHKCLQWINYINIKSLSSTVCIRLAYMMSVSSKTDSTQPIGIDVGQYYEPCLVSSCYQRWLVTVWTHVTNWRIYSVMYYFAEELSESFGTWCFTNDIVPFRWQLMKLSVLHNNKWTEHWKIMPGLLFSFAIKNIRSGFFH